MLRPILIAYDRRFVYVISQRCGLTVGPPRSCPGLHLYCTHIHRCRFLSSTAALVTTFCNSRDANGSSAPSESLPPSVPSPSSLYAIAILIGWRTLCHRHPHRCGRSQPQGLRLLIGLDANTFSDPPPAAANPQGASLGGWGRLVEEVDSRSGWRGEQGGISDPPTAAAALPRSFPDLSPSPLAELKGLEAGGRGPGGGWAAGAGEPEGAGSGLSADDDRQAGGPPESQERPCKRRLASPRQSESTDAAAPPRAAKKAPCLSSPTPAADPAGERGGAGPETGGVTRSRSPSSEAEFALGRAGPASRTAEAASSEPERGRDLPAGGCEARGSGLAERSDRPAGRSPGPAGWAPLGESSWEGAGPVDLLCCDFWSAQAGTSTLEYPDGLSFRPTMGNENC